VVAPRISSAAGRRVAPARCTVGLTGRSGEERATARTRVRPPGRRRMLNSRTATRTTSISAANARLHGYYLAADRRLLPRLMPPPPPTVVDRPACGPRARLPRAPPSRTPTPRPPSPGRRIWTAIVIGFGSWPRRPSTPADGLSIGRLREITVDRRRRRSSGGKRGVVHRPGLQ